MKHLSSFQVAAIPVPPLNEQRAIAEFLDRKTAAIDALVEKKQRLVELFESKRQALIAQAVTKGLNPDVPTKRTGLPWIARIPASWMILPLRRWLTFLTDYEANGSFADTKAGVRLDEGEPYAWYVRATDLESGRVGLVEGNRYCDRRSYEFLRKTRLSGGELLVVKRGEIGKVYLMPSTDCAATLAPNMYLLRLMPNFLPAWGHLWFSSDPGRGQLELANRSTTIGALYKDDLRECMCVVPPRADQERILAELRERPEWQEQPQRQLRRSIDHLNEYRQALITAAVTGQLDVAAQEAA